MAGRLTRFLNLEKRRDGPGAPAHEVVTKARFVKGEPEVPLDPGGDEQPFIRCPSCEADNSRGVDRCFNCQEPLQSDHARAWNAAFWAKRQHDEAAAATARPPPPEPVRHPVAVSKPLSAEERRLAEALAREVGEREQMKQFGFWRGYYDPTPIGWRMLQAIEDGWTRLLVVLGLIGVLCGCAKFAMHPGPHMKLRFVALGVGGLIVILFTPNVPRYSRWRSPWSWWW